MFSRRQVMAMAATAPIIAHMSGAAVAMTEIEAAGVEAGRPESLRHAAELAGRFFGAAARIDQIESDPALKALMLKDCAAVTPEIHLKWDSLQYNEGAYNFAPADGLVAFAVRHGLEVRGHTLLWDQSTPRWAKRKLTREKDWDLIARYFRDVLGRYAGQVGTWDVINEPIDSQNGQDGLRTNTFFRAFGPSYIARALHEARRHAPQARLVLNEYGFDYDNSVEEDRRRLFLRLIEQLRRDGAPLDGVGVQAHLDLSKGPFKPSILRGFLKELAGFDLEIVITELDVKEDNKRASLAERDRRVADEAASYLAVALEEPAVRGVVTWGLSDRHSWLQDQSRGLPSPSEAPRLNRGLPYDAALTRKDMYWALRDTFVERA